jgi:hypothetical protein
MSLRTASTARELIAALAQLRHTARQVLVAALEASLAREASRQLGALADAVGPRVELD